MEAYPFVVGKDHIALFKASKRFNILSNDFYTLPSVNAYDLPYSEHSCRICHKSYIQQRSQPVPQETPVVMTCGHIAGSQCLKLWCGLSSTPRCFICNSPLTFKDGVGAHPTKAGTALPSLSTSNALTNAHLLPQAKQIVRRGYTIEDIEAALTLLGINDQSRSPDKSYSDEDIKSAMALLGIDDVAAPGGGAATRGKSNFAGQKPSMTIKQMETALAQLNRFHGTALTLEEVEVVLASSDSKNGTKTSAGDVLKEFL